MPAPTKPKAFSLSALPTRVKHAAITYPQILAPGIAAKVVRSLTGGSSSSSKGVGAKKLDSVDGQHHYGLSIGTPGERYAPQAPTDDPRTAGIRYAQAAAAPLPRPLTGSGKYADAAAE